MAQEPRTRQERAHELLRATLATSSWVPTTEAERLVWAIRGAIVLGLLVLIASAVEKSLWAWLDLLIVPVVLALGVYLLNRAQSERERKAEVAQQVREREAAEARRERELEIENERAQDEALQAYLDQMSQMFDQPRASAAGG